MVVCLLVNDYVIFAVRDAALAPTQTSDTSIVLSCVAMSQCGLTVELDARQCTVTPSASYSGCTVTSMVPTSFSL